MFLLCIKIDHDRVKVVSGTASEQTLRWEGAGCVPRISFILSCLASDSLAFQFLYVLWSVLPQGLCTNCALCPQGPSSITLLAGSPGRSQFKYHYCRSPPLPILSHGAPFLHYSVILLPLYALSAVYLSSRMYALLQWTVWTTRLSHSCLCPPHLEQGLATYMVFKKKKIVSSEYLEELTARSPL